jgi:ribosomal protein S18 acetylase RimI-like enzyme
MEVKVRRATVEDAESIGLVQVESWRKTYAGIVPDAYLEALNIDKHSLFWSQQLRAGQMLVFVAEDPWGIFGFIAGGAIREPIEGFDAELYAIYLMPARQRRGLGQELALALREALLMESFNGMVVWVLEKNLPAVSFYKKLGGIPIAEKTIEIGGTALSEMAFGWPVL